MSFFKIQGVASRSGQQVFTGSAGSSTKTSRDYPFCTVTIYLAGTLTLATIYSDSTGTVKANPFTADGLANWDAFVATGSYDVQFSGPMVGVSFTISDLEITAASGVQSVFGRIGAVVAAEGDYTFSLIDGVAQNRLIGRGATSGTGTQEEITVGSGLLLTGTTLSAVGTISGSGTTSMVPRFTSSTVLGDSAIQDNGSTVLIASDTAVVGDFSQNGSGSVSGPWQIGGTSNLNFSTRSVITSPADGQLKFTNVAATDFDKLFFGATGLENRIEFGSSTGVGDGDFNFYAGGANAGALIEAGGFQTQEADGSSLNLRNTQGGVSIVAPSGLGPFTPWILSLPLTNGDPSGLLQTDGSGQTTWVNTEVLLSATAPVDMNTATATTLFTCPAGKSCIITKVVVRNASTSLTTASWSYGWTSAAFADVIADATHTELTGATLYTVLLAKAGALRGTAAGTFKVLMNTLQGGAATTSMDVYGYLF